MLFLLLHHNTMPFLSIDQYKFGIKKAHNIIDKLTRPKAKPKKKAPLNIEPEITQEQIKNEANIWMNMYKDHDEKIERIRHKEVQQKVQEALAQLKRKKHEKKK